MHLACKLEPKNPFAALTPAKRREYLVHVGSSALLDDLAKKGAKADIRAWLRTWREQAGIYQEQSRKYWLYR
jgi:hypothetical protein